MLQRERAEAAEAWRTRSLSSLPQPWTGMGTQMTFPGVRPPAEDQLPSWKAEAQGSGHGGDHQLALTPLLRTHIYKALHKPLVGPTTILRPSRQRNPGLGAVTARSPGLIWFSLQQGEQRASQRGS